MYITLFSKNIPKEIPLGDLGTYKRALNVRLMARFQERSEFWGFTNNWKFLDHLNIQQLLKNAKYRAANYIKQTSAIFTSDKDKSCDYSTRTPTLLALVTKVPRKICGLVVSVEDFKHRGPGFDSRALLRSFLRELGLERGPLSLVIG
jgi:hypothetical protein